MTMTLDKRINEDMRIIFTCFTAEEAKRYVGQQGYFSDEIHNYQDLDFTDFGTLDRVGNDEVPFKSGRLFYQFFLPAEFVRPAEAPAEKKWRPFTLDEFRAKFPLLSTVTLRTKSGDLYTLCVTGHGVEKETQIEYVILGGRCYDFKELLNKYDLQDKDGKWTPFGVENNKKAARVIFTSVPRGCGKSLFCDLDLKEVDVEDNNKE